MHNTAMYRQLVMVAYLHTLPMFMACCSSLCSREYDFEYFLKVARTNVYLFRPTEDLEIDSILVSSSSI